MDFQTAVSTVFRKYATISGRAPRSEYWFFQLFIFLAFLALGVVIALVEMAQGAPKDAHAGPVEMIIGFVALIFFLGIIVPQFCCTVRRLHDTNSSGWWFLLFLIPYLGGLINIIWCVIPGTPGENRYGPSPFQKAYVEDVFR